MSGPLQGRRGAPSAQLTRTRDVMLTLLAVAAGCVDGASFLGLGQVLTAAMTGNTTLLGLALGQGDAQAALRSAVALAGFVVGAFLGAAMVDRGVQGAIWSPAVTWALALELAILVILALAWHRLEGGGDWTIDHRYPLIAAAGIAMGIQSAAAHCIGVPGVTTTYVTGTLTSLASRLAGWLRPSRTAARGEQTKQVVAPWLPATVWIAYGAGAVFAGAAHLLWPSAPLPPVTHVVRWPSVALLLPIGIIVVVIVVAAIVYRRRPAPA
jgi:uncharacterized membrane protein YoaK (UPF0700 family)